MNATRRQARVAGALYLLVGVTAPIGLMVVPDQVIVRGDATATAARLTESEWLLRLGIASELFHQIVGIFLVLALYRLFRAVDETHARRMVILSLLPVPIVLLNVVHELAALVLVKGADFLSPFDQAQREALAYLFLRTHGQGITVASIFWGLWLFPFGVLAIRSRFIPRVFGILLLIAGVGYLASAFTTLVVPQYSRQVDPIALILEIAEVPIILWLAIWGARVKPSGDAAVAPATG